MHLCLQPASEDITQEQGCGRLTSVLALRELAVWLWHLTFPLWAPCYKIRSDDILTTSVCLEQTVCAYQEL